MNDAPINPPALELAESRRSERWTVSRWLAIIALIFAAHVALIFLFGERKEIVPRAVTNVPTLKLADNSDELLALNDPTLFVLPHQRDFASYVWLKMPNVKQPSFRWTEPPRPLPLSADKLGMAFGQLMQTNFFASEPLDFKPAAELSAPTLPVETAPAQNSTMQVEGKFAQRQLPGQISLTNWPYADVLPPCVVQVLVDAAGNVVSTVLLESSSYKDADDKALELARALRFTPSSSLTFGRVIFNWHTVPPTASP
jgi:TonB family protein